MKRFKSILIAITMISTLTISPLQNVKAKTDIDTAFNGDSADLSTGISPNPNADYDWQAEVCTAGTGAALGFRVTAYVCDDESTLNEISHNTNLKSWIQDPNNRNRFANILSSSSGLCFYMFNKQKIQDVQTSIDSSVYFIHNSYAKGTFPNKFVSTSMGNGDIFHVDGNTININGNKYSKFMGDYYKLLNLTEDYVVSGEPIKGLPQSEIQNVCNTFSWNASGVSFDTGAFDNGISALLKDTAIRESIAKRLAVFNDKIDWDNASILLYFEPMISMEVDVKGAVDTNGNDVYEPALGDTEQTKFCFGLTPSDCAYIAGTTVDKMYKNGGNMHTDNIFYGVNDVVKTYMLSTNSSGTSGDSSFDSFASGDIHDVAKCVLSGTYGAVSEVVALKEKPMRDEMWELPPAIQLFEDGSRQKSTTINKGDWEDIQEVLSYAKGLTSVEPSSPLYSAVKDKCQDVLAVSYDAMYDNVTYYQDYLMHYKNLWDAICIYYKNTPVTLNGDANTVNVYGNISRTEMYNGMGGILYRYSGVSSSVATSKVNVAEYQIYDNGDIVNGSKTTANGGQITNLTYGQLLKNPYNYYGIKESTATTNEPIARPIVNVVDQNTSGDGSTTLTISNDIYNDVSSCYQWMRGDIDNYNGPLKNIYEVKRARKCYEYLKRNDFAGQNKEYDVLSMTGGTSNRAVYYYNALYCADFREYWYDESGNAHKLTYDTGNGVVTVASDWSALHMGYDDRFDAVVMRDDSPKYYIQNIYQDCSRNWDDWLEQAYSKICEYYDNTLVCSSNSYSPNLYTRRSTRSPGGCGALKIVSTSENRMGSWYRTYGFTDDTVDGVYASYNTVGEQRNTWRCSSKVYAMEIKHSGSISSVNDLKNAIKNKSATTGGLTVGDLLRNPYGYGITYNSLEAATGKGLQLDSWAWKQTTKVDIPGVDSLTDLHFDLNKLIAIVEPDNKHTVNCEYTGTGTDKTVVQATITRNQSDNTAELSSLYTRSSLINSLYQDSVLQDYQNIMTDVGAPFNWFSVKSNAVKLVNASTAHLNFNQNDTDIPIELKKKDAYNEVKTLATDTLKIKGIPTNGSSDLGTAQLFDSNKTSWGADKGYIKYGSLGNNGSFNFRCVFPMTANIVNNKAFSIGFSSFLGFGGVSTKPTMGMARLRDASNTVWAYNDEWDKISAQNTIAVSYKGVPRLSGDWSTAQKDIETMKSTNIPVAYAGQVVPVSVEEINSGDSSYKNRLVITMYGLVALDMSGYETEFRGGYQTVDEFKNYVNTIATDIANNSRVNISSTLSGIQTDTSKENLGVQYTDGSEVGNIVCSNGDTIGSVASQNVTYSMRQLEGRFGKNSINTVNYGDYGISNVLGSNDEYFSEIDSLLYDNLSYSDWLYTDFEGFALVKAEVVMSYGTKNYNVTISKSESDSKAETNELYKKNKSTIDYIWKSTFGLNVHNDNEMNAIMTYIDLSGCITGFNLPSGGGTTCVRDLLGSYVCGCTTNINVRGSIFDNDNRK